jgi:hypothetical protein
MNKRLVFGIASIVIAVLLGFGATIALADPDLNDVLPHRHFIKISATEMVEVGPRVCDDPSLQEAFNQFHNNLHVSAGFGPAAPGLHNIVGAEITATPC